MSKEDNVMDLLDSLDVKQGQKTKPKKSSSKRKENNKKAAGDDILQFLDELDAKKKSGGEDELSTESKDNNQISKETEESKVGSPQKEPKSTSTSNTDTTTTAPDAIDPVASITSWWSRNKGGLWSKAQETLQDAVSDAVKQARQAEALVREEQAHFSFNSLQNRLTSVLHTIVPPITRHEQLQIHIFHDMVGYPSVDKLLYEVFDYVMDQVEGGGDLNLVVQKGKERHRVGSDYDVHKTLNYVRCSLADGIKLAKANVEEIKREREQNNDNNNNNNQTTTTINNNNDSNIRVSEVFVSIQPVVITKSTHPTDMTAESSAECLHFITYLADAEHNIEISTSSQALPYEWAQWLDNEGHGFQEAAIDPREWVLGWVEDALNLAFGVVAQKYVTTRMGLTNSEAEEKKEKKKKEKEESS